MKHSKSFVGILRVDVSDLFRESINKLASWLHKEKGEKVSWIK